MNGISKKLSPVWFVFSKGLLWVGLGLVRVGLGLVRNGLALVRVRISLSQQDYEV